MSDKPERFRVICRDHQCEAIGRVGEPVATPAVPVSRLRELVAKWRNLKAQNSKPPAFGKGVENGLELAATELEAVLGPEYHVCQRDGDLYVGYDLANCEPTTDPATPEGREWWAEALKMDVCWSHIHEMWYAETEYSMTDCFVSRSAAIIAAIEAAATEERDN